MSDEVQSLSNSQGNIHLALGSAQQVRAGKSSKQVVAIAVVAADGAYVSFVGATGTLTKWNIPANPRKPATFSGHLSG